MDNAPIKTIYISNMLNMTRQEFSLIEKQLVLLVLAKIKHLQGMHVGDTLQNIEVRFPAAELGTMHRQHLKEALDRITSRKIYHETSVQGSFTYLVPFTMASYELAPDSGLKKDIVIIINGAARKMFLELANGYSQADLMALLSLRSRYSIRLYELLTKYKKLAKWEVSISELQHLIGADPKAYSNFTNFQRQILEYSQRELSEKCGMRFTWEVSQKKGKRIESLRFHILPGLGLSLPERANDLEQEIALTQQQILSMPEDQQSEIFARVMEAYTFSAKQAMRLMMNQTLRMEFIRLDLLLTAKPEKPKNPTAYIVKSLKL